MGQVINEVDADTPGTDAAEFIEIKHTPNTALDGHVVVLFNGAGDISYAAYDLSGKTTDANGLFIIANTALVIGSDIDMGASNKLQNGADAVALFTGSAADFPDGTAVTNTNMLSGVVYDTDDGDDTGLLDAIGGVQYDERENSSSDTQSIQRKEDGTYEVKNITFRDLNSAATCDFSMSSPSVVCDAITAGVDTYTATINFTGGDGTYIVTAGLWNRRFKCWRSCNRHYRHHYNHRCCRRNRCNYKRYRRRYLRCRLHSKRGNLYSST